MKTTRHHLVGTKDDDDDDLEIQYEEEQDYVRYGKQRIPCSDSRNVAERFDTLDSLGSEHAVDAAFNSPFLLRFLKLVILVLASVFAMVLLSAMQHLSSVQIIRGNERDTQINTPIVDAPKATLERLYNAIKINEKMIENMRAYYGEDISKQIFGSMHFKNKDYLKEKIKRAILGEQKEFVISFSGTSVTAGHDNYFNQSYPLVFSEDIKPAFVAAGIDLQVRNQAMGNNPAIPASFCLNSQLGSDSDVVVWEFGMMVGGRNLLPHIELWIRNAISMAKQPALMFLDPGEGARKPEQDGRLPTTPRTGSPPDYRSYFVDPQTQTSLLDHYQEFAPHVQAMYEAVWALDTTPGYDFTALVMDDKPTSRPAPWHPGPKGHRLRGRILAYHYLIILGDALQDSVTALEAGHDPFLSEEKDSLREIPPPLTCKELFCEKPTQCYMTFEPRMQNSLMDLVASPRYLMDSLPTLESQEDNKWHVQLYEADHDAVLNSRHQGFGYVDLKYILQGDKDAGPVVFNVKTLNKGHIFLCQPPGVFGHIPERHGSLEKDAEVLLNDKKIDLISGHQFYENQLIETYICFATKEQVDGGEHNLQIKATNQEGKYITLSSIIHY